MARQFVKKNSVDATPVYVADTSGELAPMHRVTFTLFTTKEDDPNPDTETLEVLVAPGASEDEIEDAMRQRARQGKLASATRTIPLSD